MAKADGLHGRSADIGVEGRMGATMTAWPVTCFCLRGGRLRRRPCRVAPRTGSVVDLPFVRRTRQADSPHVEHAGSGSSCCPFNGSSVPRADDVVDCLTSPFSLRHRWRQGREEQRDGPGRSMRRIVHSLRRTRASGRCLGEQSSMDEERAHLDEVPERDRRARTLWGDRFRPNPAHSSKDARRTRGRRERTPPSRASTCGFWPRTRLFGDTT